MQPQPRQHPQLPAPGGRGVPEDSRETAAVREVTERLKSAYTGRRTAQEVEAVVGEAYNHLRDRPVRDFVPVLVERRARRILADLPDPSEMD
ncbi:three-helix bundle dimerization domain-containing protein [Streptomyces pratens]|uniref:Three-helix bundle dimerization domain-containing protein n=1 Tax=Streptomyces pratens TaxID=887456 RepID=A0ABW1MCB4_9ACTN